MNWYVYCGNGPVNNIYPIGQRFMVVFGGPYDACDKELSYQFEFIDTALKQISDWRLANPDEPITWAIANTG